MSSLQWFIRGSNLDSLCLTLAPLAPTSEGSGVVLPGSLSTLGDMSNDEDSSTAEGATSTPDPKALVLHGTTVLLPDSNDQMLTITNRCTVCCLFIASLPAVLTPYVPCYVSFHRSLCCVFVLAS